MCVQHIENRNHNDEQNTTNNYNTNGRRYLDCMCMNKELAYNGW